MYNMHSLCFPLEFHRFLLYNDSGDKRWFKKLAKCTKSGLVLWLGEKIRKSFYVCLQWCSATDGRTWLHEPWTARWTPFTSIFVSLKSGIIRFSYFRTPEQGSPGFVQSDSQKMEKHLLTLEFCEIKKWQTALTAVRKPSALFGLWANPLSSLL